MNCLNCEMELTEYNKTNYCTAFCEQTKTGEMVQHRTHYGRKEPIMVTNKVEDTKLTECQQLPKKCQYVNSTQNIKVLIMDNTNILTLTNPNEKHPSKAMDSFHELISQVLKIG